MKRVILFVLTNLAVVVTINILLSVLSALGVLPRFDQGSLTGLMAFCFLWGMVGSFISLQMSRFMAKRAMGLRLIDGNTGNADLDRVYNTIGHLTQQAGLPMPEVGVYDSPEVNAFATGPSQSRSLVAVSTGLLRQMDQAAVQGVLGHEITHIKNGDMVTMALLQGVINSFVMFFAHIIASVLFPSDRENRRPSFLYYIALNVIQMALSALGAIVVCWFSRQREFRADAGGAELAGRVSMIGALKSLLANQDRVDNSQQALTTFKIAGGPMALFATHPPLEVRIARLEGRA
ncbi:MAG TPA: protease HtpX [Vicinamibacteria bacterium]|nr:protease HtpX [Vicinamibacteria bacterium]